MYSAFVTDVFFDLDHTLWDFEKNSALTFRKIFEEQGVTVDIDAFLEYYVPLNLEFWKLYREERISKVDLRYQRLRKSFDAISYVIDDSQIHILSQEYIRYLSTFNHLVPNTVEVLSYLKPRYRLHIITNGFQEIQEKKLKNANIHQYFDQIVNSEIAVVKKTNPKIFQMSFSMAQVSPERALMIGDSIEADILGAQAVGLKTLHFNVHKDPVHDYCEMIDDLGEIKSYL